MKSTYILLVTLIFFLAVATAVPAAGPPAPREARAGVQPGQGYVHVGPAQRDPSRRSSRSWP